MSDLPDIDFQAIARQLASNNSDLIFQVMALENLAEALRKQRDSAVAEVSGLRETLAELRTTEND